MQRLRERIQTSADFPRWVLVACLSGMAASSFTITILGVSLKVIADDLDSTPAVVAWVLTGPMLVQALALPVLGKLGDLYGHRRVYLVGFACSMVFAFGTAAAWSAGSLIGIRVVGQLMGTATWPSSTALLFHVYPPKERVRAMGWVSLVSAGAPVFGLAVGGLMVDTIGWRPLFLIQGSLSLLALGFASLVLKETELQRDVTFDFAGAATIAVAACALTFGINRLPIWGLAHPGVVGPLALVPAALYVFVRAERRARHPLIPLGFFRRRNFVLPMVAQAFAQFAYMGGFIISPLLLLQVFGYTATATSFLTMLRPVSFSLASPVGGAIATRVGERTMVIAGMAGLVVSMASFALGASFGSILLIGGGLVVAGLAFGFFQPSISAIVGNSVDERSFGIASSATSMTSSIGAVAGVSVLTAFTADSTDAGVFFDGYALGGVAAAVAFAASWFTQGRGAAARAREAYEREEQEASAARASLAASAQRD